jgi:streptomycin 6-kinase
MEGPFSDHPGLAWLKDSPEGRDWLLSLPALVKGRVSEWSLTLGTPFSDTFVSLAVPANLSDGTEVVLKIQYPHRESEHEAEALRLWNGDGAVRLLEHDNVHHALLLERCIPGTPLSELNQNDALDVMIGLLPRLWKPAGEAFGSLRDEANWWAGYLPESWERAGRPFERSLLDAALQALRIRPESQGEQVLVNQDLHADNVLRADREPWLVIDPKPLAGEREFGIAALVRGGELGGGQGPVLGRLDRLTSDLGLDRERARRWALAQTLAWAFDGDEVDLDAVETARWLL